jgi:hypothetical protein
MRLGRHWRVAALVLVVAAVAAFLLLRGGGDEGPALSRPAFVAEANAICAELAERNLDLPPPPLPYGPLSEDFFQGFTDNVTRARDRFDELNAPSSDDAALGELVQTLGLVSTRGQEAAGAASVEQSPEVEALVAEISQLAVQAAEAQERARICPDRSSARVSIGTVIRRTGENPLTATGTLG